MEQYIPQQLQPFVGKMTPDFFLQLGSRPVMQDGTSGWLFRLWTPDATAVSVVGNFNDWNPSAAPMYPTGNGLWERFLTQPQPGDLYKYMVTSPNGSFQYHADPWAVSTELPPGTASKLADYSNYPWQDANWICFRHRTKGQAQPQLLYHLHLSSWRRTASGQPLSCRDLTTYLVPYLKGMGYTGAVLRSDFASGSVSSTGFFVPPAILGNPTDIIYLINQMHWAGLSVFLDWRPDRFSAAYAGLLAAPAPKGFQRCETTPGIFLFDWAKPEVRAFLIASALFWLKDFHLDGLRIDLPDPGLYLAHLSSHDLIHALEDAVALHCPDTELILNSPAPFSGFSGWQEHSALPLLDLFQGAVATPSQELTNSGMLSFSAHLFAAPQTAFLDRFSGNLAEQLAAARACYLTFLALPGKKLTGMGMELGQHAGWCFDRSLDWHLLELTDYQEHHAFFQAANSVLLSEPALWEDGQPNGFQWLPASSENDSLIAFLRRDRLENGILCLCNPTHAHTIHGTLLLSNAKSCHLLLSSDEKRFGGTDAVSIYTHSVAPEQSGLRLLFDLPPLTCALICDIPAVQHHTKHNVLSDDLRSR